MRRAAAAAERRFQRKLTIPLIELIWPKIFFGLFDFYWNLSPIESVLWYQRTTVGTLGGEEAAGFF